MVNDIEFRDESENQTEQKFSIKEIILRHIKKISDLSCREFTGGYWQKKPIKTSTGIMFAETYQEDVREAYCNAIDFLVDIVYPYGSKELKEYLEEQEGYQNLLIKNNDKKETKKKEVIDIKEKLILKRQTFRQINIMFFSTDFWKGMQNYNE